MYISDSPPNDFSGEPWQPGDSDPPAEEPEDTVADRPRKSAIWSIPHERDRARRQAQQVRDRAEVRLLTRLASEIEPQDVDWLWYRWLARKMIALFAGYGGGGKSTLTLYLAAQFSTGGILPDSTLAPVINILIFAGEDSPEHTIIPRLLSMGADLTRIHIVTGIGISRESDVTWVRADTHAHLIEHHIIEHEIALVIIDPISSYSGDANGDKESDVRAVLMPLVGMAERTNCAILLIRHVSKANIDGRANSRILGSVAWHDVPRLAWMIGDAPLDQLPPRNADGYRDAVRMLGCVKSNLAPKPPLIKITHPIDAPLHFDIEHSELTMEDCFTPRLDRTDGKAVEAEQWLLSYLASGPKEQKAIQADAENAGISYATLRRVKRGLHVVSKKQAGTASGWLWKLPASKVLKDDHMPPLSALNPLPPKDQAQDAQHAQHAQENHADNLSFLPDGLEPTGTEGGDTDAWTL
jgi:hypothetical protein